MSLFIKNIFLVQLCLILAILYPTSLANLVVEVGTRHSHQTLLTSFLASKNAWERPLGQCVSDLHPNTSEAKIKVDTVLCAGAAAHGAERGLNLIVWNFAWDRLASRLYAATATTFLMKMAAIFSGGDELRNRMYNITSGLMIFHTIMQWLKHYLNHN